MQTNRLEGGWNLTSFKRSAELFGHTIPAPILFAPVGINKLYTPLGELVPAKVAGELGLPVGLDLHSASHPSLTRTSMKYCLSTASSQPIEDVAVANDAGASIKNESNSVHSYDGPNGGNAKGPRFFQLYMGHDDEIVRQFLSYFTMPRSNFCYRQSACWNAHGKADLMFVCSQ